MCRKCGEIRAANAKRSNLEKFIAKANTVHNSKYQYHNSIYTEAKNKITIMGITKFND